MEFSEGDTKFRCVVELVSLKDIGSIVHPYIIH